MRALIVAFIACAVVSLLGAVLSGRPLIFILPVAACAGPILLARHPRAGRAAQGVALAVMVVFAALASATIGLLYLPCIAILIWSSLANPRSVDQ